MAAAVASRSDSKRKYSWWWDSHISPKNSKWLQENLTDMDAKVKQMIKLIEEDADSFARRAEMYYKKRPELMKMVEEFYRAYRALAERYDHATGVIRQAHLTMSENQIAFMMGDDMPTGPVDGEPRTPEMPSTRAPLDPEELPKDALGISPSPHAIKRNGAFTEEPDTASSRKGLKQLNDLFGFTEGSASKGLNFHDTKEEDQNLQDIDENEIRPLIPSDSERMGKAEMEILTLKNALAKLEADKEAGLRQYQQSLERLSNLESEVSHAKDDSQGLNKRASKAEAAVQTLKEALIKLEAERESSFLQYQRCLEKIAKLEFYISHAEKDVGELTERASKAEAEAESLKLELAKAETEKASALLQYKQCLEKVAALENKLLHAEDDAMIFKERAKGAEREVEILKQAVTKLIEEKEAAAIQHQQCLDTISDLEHKLATELEEGQRLNSEIDHGVVKLKGTEEKCVLLEKSNQTMHSELESLAQKTAAQSEELTEKQKELGRLWTCIQEERLRFIEAETAFQTLQQLHSQSQEELRSVAAEIKNRTQMLQDLEAHNQIQQNETKDVKVENKSLKEVNLSSALTIQGLQDEISSLRETIGKLESEVELRLDQRNALQQEIYCLKEELNDLNKKQQAIKEQVESAGFSPESLGSSLKDLQDENIMLKEAREKERSENVALLEKLETMKKLMEKNALLEISLSDLNVELEVVREKVRALEISCQTLLREKSTLVSEKDALVSQLQVATDNLEKLKKKNIFLESSLFDANAEIEGLRIRLEEMEKERQSPLHEIKELHSNLDAQKRKYASLVRSSKSQLDKMERKIHLLQEEGHRLKKKNEEEQLNKEFSSQIEIFILQQCVQDLEENNFSVLLEFQKLLEASRLSEKLISELEQENLEQQIEVRSLYDQIKVLRMGLFRLLKTIDVDSNQWYQGKSQQDQMLLNLTLVKLQAIQKMLLEIQDEKQQLLVENSVFVTLIGQLQLEVETLLTAKDSLHQESASRSEQYLVLQTENRKLSEMNEVLSLKIMEGERREEGLKVKLKNMEEELLALQSDSRKLSEMNEVLSLKIREGGQKEEVLKVELKNLQGELFALQTENRKLSEMNEVLSLKIMEGDRREEGLKVELKNLQVELLALQSDSRKFSEMNEVLSLKTREGDHKEEVLKVELKNLKGELLDLQSDQRKLSEMNEVLSLKIREGDHKEEALKVEVKNLQGELLDLQRSSRKLSEMNEVLSLKIREEDHKEEVLKVELKNLQGELLDLQSERSKLSEMNEVLSSKIRERDNKEEALQVELKNLQGELLDLQSSSRKLSEMNGVLSLKIREGDHKEEVLKIELKNLQGELLDLQGSYKTLQEESRKMLDEEMTLKNFISELRDEKSNLEEENCANFAEQASLGILSLTLRDIISANYMEIEELRKSHEKLCSVNDNLNMKLKLMEEKVMEASVIQDEKSELHKTVGHLKSKCDEVERKEADQEKKMMILSSDYDEQRKVLECTREENMKLKSELQLLNEELVEARSREEILNREILKGQDEIEHWESQAAALYGDLLIYAVNQELFEGKIQELIKAFKDLEGRNSFKDLEIEKFKERISPLESENQELKAQMMSYVPAFISLSDSITSLENHTLSHGGLVEVDKEAKNDRLARHVERLQKVSKEQGAMGAGGNLDFQTLEARIRAIEEAVTERDRAFVLEISNANSKLGAAIGQLEELKSRKHLEPIAGSKQGTQNSEDSKLDHEKSRSANEVMTKDIVLDQISESPSNGIGQRETVEADNQMLEIWETAEKDSSIDITAAPAEKKHGAYPSRESMLEKEVSIDKLEISRRMSGSRQEVTERQILERLNSDAQKLINLQITVQDLKRKLEITDKNRKRTGIEYDSVKEKLEESDETIAKFSEANHRLKQSIQDKSFFSDESGSVRRRKITEEAKQGSEKIGRLQMEVQKLQVLLLKLDDDNKSRGKSKIVERSARVLLRDYLYGGTRNGQKKRCLCACVQPATKGD